MGHELRTTSVASKTYFVILTGAGSFEIRTRDVVDLGFALSKHALHEPQIPRYPHRHSCV